MVEVVVGEEDRLFQGHQVYQGEAVVAVVAAVAAAEGHLLRWNQTLQGVEGVAADSIWSLVGRKRVSQDWG